MAALASIIHRAYFGHEDAGGRVVSATNRLPTKGLLYKLMNCQFYRKRNVKGSTCKTRLTIRRSASNGSREKRTFTFNDACVDSVLVAEKSIIFLNK